MIDPYRRKMPEPIKEVVAPGKTNEKIAQITEELSRYLVKAQFMLTELAKEADVPSTIELLTPKATATKHENYVHIEANIYPPKINVHPSNQKGFKHPTTYAEVRDTWYTVIQQALEESEHPLLEDAIILIRYRRNRKAFDAPNHNAKFIIDAIVYNDMLIDDSKDNLTLVIIGVESSDEGTDIYIGDKQKFAYDLLKLIGVKMPCTP